MVEAGSTQAGEGKEGCIAAGGGEEVCTGHQIGRCGCRPKVGYITMPTSLSLYIKIISLSRHLSLLPPFSLSLLLYPFPFFPLYSFPSTFFLVYPFPPPPFLLLSLSLCLLPLLSIPYLPLPPIPPLSPRPLSAASDNITMTHSASYESFKLKKLSGSTTPVAAGGSVRSAASSPQPTFGLRKVRSDPDVNMHNMQKEVEVSHLHLVAFRNKIKPYANCCHRY